jgi:ParB-like chromosome segregation protein Spo0J
MELVRLAISEIRAAPYNPRLTLRPGDDRYERLKRSLLEFDLVQPLVFNRRTGHLVGGHQRLEVLKNEGAEEVDCIVVDLPLEREKALNVALNNSAVGGDWDISLLTPLLEELQGLPTVDATLTGFSEAELRDLVLAPQPAEQWSDGTRDSADAECATVTLEVPMVRWSAVRSRLDELLAEEESVVLHVRLP